MNQSFLKNTPALKIVTPLILGIVVAVLLKLQHSVFIWLAIATIILSFLSFYIKKFKHRFLTGGFLFSSIFLLGICLVKVKTDVYKNTHFSHFIGEKSILVATVNEALVKKNKSNKTVLTVSHVINDNQTIPVQGNILTYLRIDSAHLLHYGDKILFKNYVKEVEAPSNPEQFNYKHYLTLNNIHHQVYLTSSNYVKVAKNKGNQFIKFSYQARDYLYNQLQNSGIHGDELKVASALLLGYRELLDQELIQAYSSAGAMHVLAVSGLHVGILFFILKFSLGFLLRLKRGKYLFTAVILFALWGYALITGFSPSVLRASTMFSFILVGEQLVNRKVSVYNTLAVSAIVLLIVNPYLIFEVGFQLSYLAVIGIVYLQPKIYGLLTPNNFILDNAWKITAVSIAAQIATFPLGLYYFHQFPVYFFVSNLVVIPAATIILYLGVMLFITSPFGGVSLVIGKLLGLVIFALNYAVNFTKDLPLSLVQEISISRLDTYMLYLFIVILLFFLYYRKLRYFYLSGIVLLSFLVIQVYDKVNDLNRKDFTIYSVNHTTAFEFSSGKSTYFFAPSSFYKNDAQMLFNIKHNWYKKNITNIHYLGLDSLNFRDDYCYVYNGVIRFSNKTFVYLNKQNINLVNSIKPEVIIVSNAYYKLLYKIEKNLHFKTKIVFDSSIKDYYYDYWKKRLNHLETVSTSSKFYHENLLN